MAVADYREVVMINYSRFKAGSWAEAYAGIVVSCTISKNFGMIITERGVLCGRLFACWTGGYKRRRQMEVKVEISGLGKMGWWRQWR
jgi:hypothetical protein